MAGQTTNKPAARLVVQGSKPISQANAEELQEAQERYGRQEELDRRNAVRTNKVAMLLSATHFVTDYAFPFLQYQGRQLSVSEYYPEYRTAIDKFYDEDYDRGEVALKKAELNKHGYRYGYLTPEKEHQLESLADMLRDKVKKE
jgi:hypothetical protein